MAAEETFEQDTLLLKELSSMFNPRPTSEDLFDFVGAIGICGTSKTTEKAIECLSNGMTLEDLLELVVDRMIDSLKNKTS